MLKDFAIRQKTIAGIEQGVALIDICIGYVDRFSRRKVG